MHTFFCGLKCTFPAYYVRIPRMVLNIVWNDMNNDCNIAPSNKQTTHTMKNTNIKIALLSAICFLLSLVLINLGEDMSNRGIVFMGLLSLSASTFILAFLLGEVIVSTFKK